MAKYLLKSGTHKEGDTVYSCGPEGSPPVTVEADRDLVKVFGREKFGYELNVPKDEGTAKSSKARKKKLASLESEAEEEAGVTYDGGLKIDPKDTTRKVNQPQRAGGASDEEEDDEDDETEVEGLVADDGEDEDEDDGEDEDEVKKAPVTSEKEAKKPAPAKPKTPVRKK